MQENQQTHQIYNTLAFLVQNCDTNQVSFPILPNGYSLWRSLAYRSLIPSQKSHQLFYLHSQCLQLRNYVQKLKDSNQNNLEMLRKISSERSQQAQNINNISTTQNQQLLMRYGSKVWMLTLYGQLFLDLITIPYLKELFAPTKRYKIRKEFNYNFNGVYGERTNQYVQQISEGIIKKGLGAISQRIISKTFMMQMSAFMVTINPVAMVASFGLSKAIQKYKQTSKYNSSLDAIHICLKNVQHNVDFLQNTYQETISLIGKYLYAEKPNERQIAGVCIIKLVERVLQKDWLLIEQHKDADGWTIVTLGEEEESLETSILKS